jgi:hypothetical protein
MPQQRGTSDAAAAARILTQPLPRPAGRPKSICTAEPTVTRHFVIAGGRMCEAQRIDLRAAREGRMTWRAYFEKWELG